MDIRQLHSPYRIEKISVPNSRDNSARRALKFWGGVQATLLRNGEFREADEVGDTIAHLEDILAESIW